MLIEKWEKLPVAKKMQLAKSYSIRWCGTNLEQLEFELKTKLPLNFLGVDETVVEEPMQVVEEVSQVEEPTTEPTVETIVETVVEAKPKKTRKSKSK